LTIPTTAPALRFVVLCLAAAGGLAACAQDVAMRDPRSGQAVTCAGGGVNPWSQNYACAAGLAMQGWTRPSAPPGSIPAPGFY
jgi:hypothetical protein